MVKLWVANTDNDWFDFLALQPGIDEVNFWQPSGSSSFGAIQPGELFLFRLKSPRNVIGGYGVFSHASNLPISLAWEAFGIKNGATDLDAMRTRVNRYRGDNGRGDYLIGCRILVQPVFLPEALWIPQPRSWANAIVVGKRFNTDEPEGRDLWEHIVTAGLGANSAAAPGFAEEQARLGTPTLVTPRLGQGAFRIAVTDAYRRQCAVSGGKVLPALDAAHIHPFHLDGPCAVSNGLLLRRDIHSIFDAGYVTVDENFRFVVSERVRTEFNNGDEYRRLHGAKISLPDDPRCWPEKRLLSWHNNNVYRG